MGRCIDNRRYEGGRRLSFGGELLYLFCFSEYCLAITHLKSTVRCMILSFADKQAEKLWQGKRNRFPSDLQDRIANKLSVLNAATVLDELRVPPSNQLEALRGNRNGQHSIRINQQWRICFRWDNGNVHEVEVTDYH
jgi:proteic killer suppression protein